MNNDLSVPQVNFHHSVLNNSIEIIDLQSLYQRSKHFEHDPAKPHRVNFYLLIYIEKGNGTHFIDFNYHPFEPGSYIFISRNQIHAFDFSNELNGKAILFTNNFIEQLQVNMKSPVFSPTFLDVSYSPIFTPDIALQQSSKVLFCEIEKETKQKEGSRLIVMFLFSSLLLMLARSQPKAFQHPLTKKQLERFTHFMYLLENNNVKTRDASLYAQKVHVTYKTLNQLCKLAVGQTAKQLIDAYTVLEAKRRLVIETKPIQQLADELGFDETTNFVKYFKKHTLLTPTQFSKQAKS